MSTARVSAAMGACLLLCAGTAAACGEALQGATRTIEGKDYIVVFKTMPDRIPVGEHFALDFAVCPRAKGEAPSVHCPRAGVHPLNSASALRYAMRSASGGGRSASHARDQFACSTM